MSPSIKRPRVTGGREKRRTMKWRSAVVLGAKLSWGRCCCWIVLVASALAEERRYSTKYDNIDIDTVVKNERLVSSYVGCLLDKRPCTPDAAELKTNLPDALATNCSHCTKAQKRISDKLMQHLIEHRPADWSLLEAKFDPNGVYRQHRLEIQRELRKDVDKEDEEEDKEENDVGA